MPNLFNKKILNTYIKNHSISNYKEKISVIQNWQKNLETIKRHNEKELQAAFLKGIFGNVLGYTDVSSGQNEWTIRIEASTEIDASAPDGILGFYSTNNEYTQAVIELKGPEISLDKKQKRSGKNYGTPVDQAFSYTSKYDKCKWVIVSNMIEIRLYKVGRSQEYFEVFHLSDLDQEQEFKKLHLLLSMDNLINKSEKSFTMELSERVEEHTEDISVKFYNLFKNTRINLFEHLKENNPDIDREILLEKAQKFLDRIIFIAFCEDIGLLPNRILHKAIERGEGSFSTSNTTVWNEIRGVFRSIDQGNPSHNINAYNGGLFKYDEVLDNLTIKNDFFKVIDDLSGYDFDSDLDVNILGHIFEQSISDIEELKADIRNEEYNREKSRRKKDGIYYTPKYITSYIVENSVGKYLEDIRNELGEEDLPEIESASTPQVKGRYRNQHLRFYHEYEDKLKEIKILDPACGSGAFLNQAFDYLLNEHKWVRKQISLLEDKQTSIFGVEALQRNILKENLYGVDLNEESVNITKLSLWLKTANKNEPLIYLDDNIKCGNSLIDDPEVAGEKAFCCEKEFPQIFGEGGFDIVIGNPPYGASFTNIEKEYFNTFYKVAEYQLDSYVLFIEKSINLLTPNGYLGFITPNTFLLMNYYYKIRKFILNNCLISNIVSFKYPVFEEAVVDTIIFIIKKVQKIEKSNKSNIFPVIIINNNEINKLTTSSKSAYNVNQEYFLTDPSNKFNIYIDERTQNLINKLSKISNLDTICSVTIGIKPYQTGKGNPPQTKEDVKSRIYDSFYKKDSSYKQYLVGRDIKKYMIQPQKSRWIKYGDCLAEPRYSAPFNENKKILVRQTSDKLICTLDENKFLTLNNIHNIKINNQKLNYYSLLAQLNSNLHNFYLQSTVQEIGKTFAEVKAIHLKKLPLLIPNKYFQSKAKQLVKKISKFKNINYKRKHISFYDYTKKYTSQIGSNLDDIIKKDNYYNNIYSGRARKVRNITININDTILTLYSDKSGSGKYELMKFEVEDEYKRQYLKLYLENLTEDQLEVINNYEGGLVKKVLQIEIPDYNKDNVVKKVVNEWDKLQNEIMELKEEIEKTDKEIDQMVYDLYELTDEEIKIVEKTINKIV